jgi:hypothetical protein
MAALVVASNQTGVTSIASDATYTDVTISSVVVAKSIVLFSCYSNSDQPTYYTFTACLTSSTNLRVARKTTGDIAMSIRWQVIEFATGASVQQLYITPEDEYAHDETITSVNTAKSFPILTLINQGSLLNNDDLWTARITSATNVQFGCATNVDYENKVLCCQIVTIDDATVAEYTGTTDTDGSTSVTISAVTLAKTFEFFTFKYNGSIFNRTMIIPVPTSTTNINFTRQLTSAGGAYDYSLYVVSISDNLTVQNIASEIASSASSVSSTITSVTTSNTVLNNNGLYQAWGSANAADDDAAKGQVRLTLDSATQFTVDRYDDPALICDTHVQVLDFSSTTGYNSSHTTSNFKVYPQNHIVSTGINVLHSNNIISFSSNSTVVAAGFNLIHTTKSISFSSISHLISTGVNVFHQTSSIVFFDNINISDANKAIVLNSTFAHDGIWHNIFRNIKSRNRISKRLFISITLIHTLGKKIKQYVSFFLKHRICEIFYFLSTYNYILVLHRFKNFEVKG